MTVLIPYASLEPAPWKNGGGSTIEIAVSPPGAPFDEFDWRISLATIAHDGPFSVFRDIDRTLALVEGPGVSLDIDGDARFVLNEDSPIVEFPGEAEVTASMLGAPTTDFNVMTRRSRCHHRLGRRSLEGISEFAPRGDITILFLAEGESLSVSSDTERIGMVRFDAVIFDTDTVWKLETGTAAVLVIDIFLDEA